MALNQLSRIERSIEIDAPPARVFRALTDAQELGVWFRVAIEGAIAPGEEVWMTSLAEGHAGQRFNVRIGEMTPPHRMVWHWHPGEVDPAIDYAGEPRTTVTFVLTPTAGGTRLTVTETGFGAIGLERRAKVFQDNSAGWTEVLTWLRRHVQEAR